MFRWNRSRAWSCSVRGCKGAPTSGSTSGCSDANAAADDAFLNHIGGAGVQLRLGKSCGRRANALEDFETAPRAMRIDNAGCPNQE